MPSGLSVYLSLCLCISLCLCLCHSLSDSLSSYKAADRLGSASDLLPGEYGIKFSTTPSSHHAMWCYTRLNARITWNCSEENHLVKYYECHRSHFRGMLGIQECFWSVPQAGMQKTDSRWMILIHELWSLDESYASSKKCLDENKHVSVSLSICLESRVYKGNWTSFHKKEKLLQAWGRCFMEICAWLPPRDRASPGLCNWI